MANEQNLIPQAHVLSVEEQSKGGKASVAKRREQKALKDTLEELLAMPLKDGKSADIDKIKSIAGIKGKNITMQEAIMVAMLNKALKGDVKAAEYVRDTIGQKPDSKMNIEHEGTIRSEKLEDIISQIGGEGLTE